MGTKNKMSDTNFWMLRDFKFVKSCKEKTEHSIERVHEGTTYHEERFNTVTGKLQNIMVWDEPNEKNGGKPYQMIAFNLMDGTQKECVQMYFGGYASESILNRLINPELNFLEEVEITIRKREREGKDPVDNVCLYQGVYPAGHEKAGKEKLIEGVFTKDNKESFYGPIPELFNAGTDDKPVWVNVKRLKFWTDTINVLNEKIRSTIEAAQNGGATTNANGATTTVVNTTKKAVTKK